MNTIDYNMVLWCMLPPVIVALTIMVILINVAKKQEKLDSYEQIEKH